MPRHTCTKAKRLRFSLSHSNYRMRQCLRTQYAAVWLCDLWISMATTTSTHINPRRNAKMKRMNDTRTTSQTTENQHKRTHTVFRQHRIQTFTYMYKRYEQPTGFAIYTIFLFTTLCTLLLYNYTQIDGRPERNPNFCIRCWEKQEKKFFLLFRMKHQSPRKENNC